SLLLLAAVAGALGACDREDRRPSFKPPPRLAIEASEPRPGSARLRVPRSVAAGVVRIQLENRGKLSHRAQLVRVDRQRSRAEVVAAMRRRVMGGPAPRWLHLAGGVGSTGPGVETTASQELRPGRYYAVDTGSPGRGEPRYFERGAIAAFRVAGRGGAAVSPTTPSHVAAFDYGFNALNLRAGKNLVRIENVGKQPHQLVAVPIPRGKAIADVRRLLRQGRGDGKSGGSIPPDFPSTGETAVLDPRTGQVTEIALKRGRYALLCLASDRAGGAPHAAKGMVSPATVT
ncbi:MAG: hypothetical protein M3141_04780, partial [Actinomycetota bacterium]|nr:hypothetical protein [Actinomycetota bacterium]